MKLGIPAILLSLFSSLSYATVTINDVPSRLRVGQEVVLSWTSDRDYVSTRHPAQFSYLVLERRTSKWLILCPRKQNPSPSGRCATMDTVFTTSTTSNTPEQRSRGITLNCGRSRM